jgi:hypothetical protein
MNTPLIGKMYKGMRKKKKNPTIEKQTLQNLWGLGGCCVLFSSILHKGK